MLCLFLFAAVVVLAGLHGYLWSKAQRYMAVQEEYDKCLEYVRSVTK